MKNSLDKILVIGAAGMLGSQVAKQLQARGENVHQATRKEMDLADEQSIVAVLDQVKPDVVINCAAYTNVDGAEDNEELAATINGYGVGNLAKQCKRHNAYLIHVSTDYVFDGLATSPYRPCDNLSPQSAYGRSKLLGETLIQSQADQYAIVRTSWLFGMQGQHFIKTILKLANQNDHLKVVNDQIGCPTHTRDLARCLIEFSHQRLQGIFHFCNGPACSWFDLASEAIKLTGIECVIEPCDSHEFPRPAPRPKYSVLDSTETVRLLDWKPSDWSVALSDYLSSETIESYK